MRVAIVGGGVIGCSIAYHLQEAGADVVLLERGEIGGEASGAAAGMLIAPIEDTGNETFNELRRASLEMYPRLVAEVEGRSGIDVEYKQPGMLRTARTNDFARKLRSACDKQPGLEWVDGTAVRGLEPALSQDVLGAAYSEADADLNPGAWTNALAAASRKLGADVRSGEMVTGFLTRGDRVEGVSTNAGDVRGIDAVVLAAGPWTEPLTVRLRSCIDTPPMRGQMIAYRSKALRHAVWGEHGYLVPKPRGFVWAGATVEDVGFRKTNTVNGLRSLERMARDLVPTLRKAEVASAWAGLRPGSADGLPVMGRVPGKENVFVATGHFRNGILLAPITGQLMCRLILYGEIDSRLRPFGPERFARS